MTVKTKTLDARVLVDFLHQGEKHPANSLLTLTAEEAEGLQQQGYIDTHPSAVKAVKQS